MMTFNEWKTQDCNWALIDDENSAIEIWNAAQAAMIDAAAGQWVHCSPALLNAGVSCVHTPRRACLCDPENGGHDHFIAHNRSANEPKAALTDERIEEIWDAIDASDLSAIDRKLAEKLRCRFARAILREAEK
jgi:hypothetical protein